MAQNGRPRILAEGEEWKRYSLAMKPKSAKRMEKVKGDKSLGDFLDELVVYYLTTKYKKVE